MGDLGVERLHSQRGYYRSGHSYWIEALYHTPAEIQEAVCETVIHEVGHYFGLDDERIDELMEQ